MNKRQKKTLFRWFLGSIGISSAVMIIGVGILALLYNYKIKVSKPEITQNQETGIKEEKSIHKNIAVFGLDEDKTRTDIIFIVHINTDKDTINLVSVPRDTEVQWSETYKNRLEELNCLDGFGINTVDSSKLNEMSHYGGVENIRVFTVDYLESLFGIKIDNYVVVSIDAFKQIVDSIGGVEVDVPREMKYDDSYQDLHIDLEPGLQSLSGEQAEGLMRWRHNNSYSEQYGEGDVGRIETQQLFYHAFAKKVLSPEIIKNIPKLIPIVFSEIKTDIASPKEILDYYNELKEVDLSTISFYIAEGEAKRTDRWYYEIDMDAIENFTNRVFLEMQEEVVEEGKENTVAKENNTEN